MEVPQVFNPAAVPGQVKKREGKHLTFTRAGKDYGMGILKDKEIIGMMNVAAV